MNNNIIFSDDFFELHLVQAVYWRNFYIYYVFYSPFYFIGMRFIFINFFHYFWVVKSFNLLNYAQFSIVYFLNFKIESDILIDDYDCNLNFSYYFCIEIIFPSYPAFFKKIITTYTNIDYKYFSLLFEIPNYVDFYPYDKKEIKRIKRMFRRKIMKVRRVHHYDKLTRSLKRSLIK